MTVDKTQTIRIDIPPEIREEMRLGKFSARAKPLPVRGPAPPIPDSVRQAAKSVGGTDFQQLFQSVYDGALIAEMDGRIVDANSRACDFLQYPQSEIRKLTLTDIVSGSTPSTIESLRASLEKKRFVLIQAHCSRMDRSIFPSEIAVNILTVHARPYLCLFIRDVSQRRAAEEMLQAVHSAVQNSSTGIAIADASGVVTYLNIATARLWGFDRTRDIMGKNLRDLFSDPTLADAIMETTTNGQTHTSEIVLSVPGQRPFYVQVMAAANKDSDGHFAGVVLSFLDISDRRRAEEAELQAERQRTMVESLGAACHHLGQPATILLTSLELMTRGGTDHPANRELLSSSMEAAESLRTILHKLNEMTEYKTTSYVSEPGDEAGGARILAIRDGI